MITNNKENIFEWVKILKNKRVLWEKDIWDELVSILNNPESHWKTR